MKTSKDCPYCIRHNSADCKHCFEVEKPEEKPVSDTPRCDKHKITEHERLTCLEIHSVDYDFACGLERELAEANRKLVERISDDQKYLVTPLCDATQALDDCQAKLASTEIELEQARAEIERLKNKNTASVSAHMWGIMRHAFISGAHEGYEHGTEYKLLEQMFTEFCNKDYPEAVEKEVERLAEIDRKDALIVQMAESMEDFVAMFTDTKKYPDPETVTTGLRILLPKMLIEIEAAKGGK